MKNVYFIGFRGVGKTTISKLVAKELEKKYISIDNLIEKKEDETIFQIIEKKGWNHFRKIESEVLAKLVDKENYIIDCGGGIIEKKKNRNILKKNICVYLTSNIKIIEKRIQKSKNRVRFFPNLKLNEEIKILIQQRTPYYEKLSTFKISTSTKTKNEVVKSILNFIQQI